MLAIKDENGALLEKIDVVLNEAAKLFLLTYLEFMDRVCDATLLQRGMPGVTSLAWKAGEGWTVTCAEYTNQELHELLHVLRPLILKREPYSFQQTSSMLSRLINSERFNKWLRRQRSLYEKGEPGLYMQFSINEQKIFDESFLSLWLNAEQYHSDLEKKAAWSQLESALTSRNARGLLMGQLQGRVKALLNLAYIANLLIGKERVA